MFYHGAIFFTFNIYVNNIANNQYYFNTKKYRVNLKWVIMLEYDILLSFL